MNSNAFLQSFKFGTGDHTSFQTVTENVLSMAEKKDTQSSSHAGKHLRSYTVQFKFKDAIKCAEESSNHAAERKFDVDRKRIREWRKQKDKLQSLSKSTARKLPGAGRKPLDYELEDNVAEWVISRRANRLRASKKMMMVKARSMYTELTRDNEDASKFIASQGWCQSFM